MAVDPSQSQGLLNSQRMASLALLASVRAAHNHAEAELTTLLSPLEFQALRDGLRAAGRSFKDLVKTGGTWSLPPPTDHGGSISSGSADTGASNSSSSGSSIMGSFQRLVAAEMCAMDRLWTRHSRLRQTVSAIHSSWTPSRSSLNLRMNSSSAGPSGSRPKWAPSGSVRSLGRRATGTLSH
jgi:hypothetical protein